MSESPYVPVWGVARSPPTGSSLRCLWVARALEGMHIKDAQLDQLHGLDYITPQARGRGRCRGRLRFLAATGGRRNSVGIHICPKKCEHGLLRAWHLRKPPKHKMTLSFLRFEVRAVVEACVQDQRQRSVVDDYVLG